MTDILSFPVTSTTTDTSCFSITEGTPTSSTSSSSVVPNETTKGAQHLRIAMAGNVDAGKSTLVSIYTLYAHG